jgi:hypothetical protein
MVGLFCLLDWMDEKMSEKSANRGFLRGERGDDDESFVRRWRLLAHFWEAFWSVSFLS